MAEVHLNILLLVNYIFSQQHDAHLVLAIQFGDSCLSCAPQCVDASHSSDPALVASTSSLNFIYTCKKIPSSMEEHS